MEPSATIPAATSYMTVPAPSLNGESAPQNPTFNPNGLPGQEVHIAKVQNTITAMEEQKLTADPRFQSLTELKERIQSGKPLTAPSETPTEPPSNVEKKALDQRLITQFKAQLAAYRSAKTSSNIPLSLLTDATLPQKKAPIGLPIPYEMPGEGNGEKLPYDLAKLHHIMLMKSNKVNSTHPPPNSLDPSTIARERDLRISGRIISRIKELSELPYEMPSKIRTRAEIELRGLRLINVQAAVRREVLHALTIGSTVEQGLNAFAYRRVKKHTLREARITEKLEKQQKMEQERRRRNRHLEFLQSTIQASKDFREFHRNNSAKLQKVRKAMATYHANNEKERKKDEQKNEKLRMMKLMQEDEEGYRQLLDEKKDKRLVYLLQQTDEYVESLTGLVRQHQQTEKTRKKRERHEARVAAGENEEIPIVVRNCITHEVLKPEETPKAEELEAWLETHPGYEVVSRDAASDSDSEDERVEEPKPVPEAEPEPDDDIDEEARNKRIIEKARNEEDEYDQKTRKQMESYYATAHKIKEKVVKQHSTMGGGDPNLQLKPYQIKGLEWMVSLYNNNLNGILADEMGLGKTIQTVSLITYLMEVKKINGPYLIIVPLSTISNWSMELDKWAPNVVTIVYKGTKDVRRSMDNQVKKGAFNVLLTTYDYVLKEKGILGKIKWKYMIIDEGHRMKNHNCKLTLTLNAYFSAQHRLLLTGTPLQNKLPELWALMNFLLPTIFSSCGTFEQWFNAPFATTGEKVELNEEETMLIIRRLHKVLRPFLLRRLKREVESQLPEKTEQLIKCDMSPLQRLMYRHMQHGLLLDSSRKEGRALMNTVIHLRKLCNHPFLFENVEVDCSKFWDKEISGMELMRVAGKFELLDRILPKLQRTGHRVLIFCQMTQLMTIMEDYFNYKGWLYLRLDGSTKPDERGELLKKYNAPDSPIFLFMLSTRAGGLGLNLQTADTVIIFDSDWNPHQDMQAQDRAHRIGQKKEVRVFRLITVNSVEEKILAAARYKLNVDEKVIQAGKFDQRSTGAERRQMLEAIIRRDDDDDDDEVPDDEAINNIIARGDAEFDLFQQMDVERHAKEAAEGFTRLVRYEEIPDNIIQSSKNFEEAEERRKNEPVQDESDSRRSRKKVDYSADLMSERDWLKTIDEPLPDSEDEDEAPQRKPRKSDVPAKRGRKKRQREEDEDDEDTSMSRTPGRKRRRETQDPVQDHLNTLLEKLIGYTGSDGSQISEDFMQLPSRRELPEYYEIVNRPIDFIRIRKNLKTGRYVNLDALNEDIELLCHNAQTFNRDDSDIHQNSKVLHHVWEKLKQLSPASGGTTSANSSPATGGDSGNATPHNETAD